MARYPVYVASWIVPAFTTMADVKAMAGPLGLTLIGWRRLSYGNKRVTLKADSMRAVDLLAANLDYPPDEVRRLWPV